MNTVIWARVSSREQREGYSIDAQLRVCKEKAQREGWNVVHAFEVAESARRGADRQAFNEMVSWVKNNAKRKDIKAILSHKLDRICRNMRDAVRMQEMEDKYGVKLAFVDNEFGPGAAGMLSFNVMAAVAQYYSDNLRTEVQKGISEKVLQGWAPGLAPYGYCNDGNDKEEPIKPDPEKSRAVQRIFELYARGGYTFQTLADKLHREGHIYRNSQPKFIRPALSYILNNRFYIGEVTYKGQQYPGKHRLFITKSIFDKCQDILNGKNRRTSVADLPLAGGLLRCAHCGFAITGERIRRKLKGGGHREHIYYRCGNNESNPDHPAVRWKEEDVERSILDELKQMVIPDRGFRAAFRTTLEMALSDSSEYQRQQNRQMKKRLSEIQGMKDRLLTAYLGALIDEMTLQNKTTELTTEEKSLKMTLQMTPYEPESDRIKRILGIFEFSQNIEDYWRGSNSAEKRKLLEIVSLNRHLSDVSLCVEKRKPFEILSKTAKSEKSRRDKI
ncbi:MAG: recombinase family protein [Phycisphaerae bacterium]|nr:recombinase family protein [Phycisphaerae bacterium]